MDPNGVFSYNLRRLCATKASIAKVARDLGINKVQMGRYLNGTSFPKPHQLKDICDYFDQDARILLEPLSGLKQKDSEEEKHLAHSEVMYDLFRAMQTETLLSEAQGTFEVGLYKLWRRSMARDDKFIAALLQMSCVKGVRVFRGYDTRHMYPNLTIGESKELRGFRSLCFRQNTNGDHIVLFVHNESLSVVSTMYLSPNVASGLQYHSGFVTLARRSIPNQRRLSNCVLEKVKVTPKKILELARMKTWLDEEDVPKHILPIISKDVTD